MSLITIFLLLVFVIVAITIALKSLFDTSAFRIFLVMRAQARREKEEREEAEKYRIRSIEEVKNKDKLLETILKIKKGEEVKIPLAAFTYIYQNLDNFTLVDKTGKLTILDQKSYFEFKNKATELLEKNEPVEIDVKEIIEQEKGKIPTKPIEITEHPDGTIVKRDHINSTAEITKPNGDKIFIDLKNDSMVFEKIEEVEEEELSKKEYAKKQQQKEKEEKEKEQKIKLLEAKNKEQAQKLKELEDIANNLENAQEKDEKPEQKNEEKEQNEINKIEEIVKNNDASKPKNTNMFFGPQNKIKKVNNNEKEEKPKETKVIDNIKLNEVKTSNLKTLEFEDFESFLAKLSHKNVVEFLEYLLCFNTNCDLPLLVFEEETNCILINLNYFSYKIYMSIKGQDMRETFLKDFYVNIEKSIVENIILGKIIEKINNSSVFKLGSKVLYQEKKDSTLINFKSAKIKSKNDILYQGVYLYFFTNNSFGKEFKDSEDFKKIQSCNFSVVESKERGRKIFFNDFLENEK